MLVSDYEDVFKRLSPETQRVIRNDLLRQLQGTLQAIANDRFETLNARYKIQSVLKQILEKKHADAIRPLWGSW